MLKELLLRYKNNEKLKQVITLFSVNIISIPLSIISSVIVTRFLGASVYGDFKFLHNIFTLAVLIFTFGFFQAGNRALVLNNDHQKARELYGAEFIILIALSILMALSLLGYAFLDNNVNDKGLRNILILLIPFSWVFLLLNYFEVLFQADNKIKLLANARLYPKLLYFILVLILYLVYFNFPANRLILIWGFLLGSEIIVYIYIIYKIRPIFKNIGVSVKEIFFYNKTFGFNVYLGSLIAVGFSQLTGILISYFASDNSGVGYFSLATTIALPLSFIPNVIATTHYKEFSTKENIPRKLLVITIAVSIAALMLTILLVRPFIKYFYGPQFMPVISLTSVVSFGIILYGFADFINRFLGSHGKGKALRNSAIIVGFSLLILNVILIPRYGETGAAYTKLLSGLVYIICMIWFYKKLVKDLKNESDNGSNV